MAWSVAAPMSCSPTNWVLMRTTASIIPSPSGPSRAQAAPAIAPAVASMAITTVTMSARMEKRFSLMQRPPSETAKTGRSAPSLR